MNLHFRSVARGLAAFLLVTPLLELAPAVAAAWTVASAPTEEEPFDAAQTLSDAGDSLLVWSRQTEDGIQVFAELHPAEGVAFASIMPVYRVDADEPVDTDIIRFKGEERNALWGLTRERVTFWLLWQSSDPIVKPGDPLHRWLQGQALEISIRLADGSTRVMHFSLEGSSAAIQKATGVAME